MKREIPAVLTLTLCLVLAGCVDRQAQKQAKATQAIVSDPTQVVSVMPVVPTPLSDTLEITGQVTTTEDASVGAKQSGKLVAVYVKDGDPVSAGEVIAQQDVSSFNDQLRQSVAGLSSAESQLSQAIANEKVGPSKSAAAVAQAQSQVASALATLEKVKNGARKQERIQTEWTVKQTKTNLDIAQKDMDRKQNLFNEGAIPKTELEQAQNAFVLAQMQYTEAVQNQSLQNEGARPEDIAVAQEAVRSAREQLRQAQDQQKLDVLYSDQVRAAESAVQSAKAQVDLAKQAIADCQIKAPFAGRVSGKPVQPGEVVGPGSTVARIIGAGGDYFDGDVPEDQITQVQSGSPVQIRLTAIPGKTFSGHIAAINPLGSETGRLFSARITFDSSSPEIRPGMFARGVITLRTIPNAIVVPAAAVVSFLEHPTVFVMNGSTAVTPHIVTTGLRKDDIVQIVDGLAPGERVVVKGQENLTAKTKVRVENQVASAETSPSASVGG